MKKLITLIVLTIVATSSLWAQKLVIGERAPELKVKEWVDKKPTVESQAKLIEFFYSASKPSIDRLRILDELSEKYKTKLLVIIIAKEDREKIVQVVNPGSRKFYTALDDAGKSFSSYGVQFVPFSVIVDARGKVLWMGNSASLSDEVINNVL